MCRRGLGNVVWWGMVGPSVSTCGGMRAHQSLGKQRLHGLRVQPRPPGCQRIPTPTPEAEGGVGGHVEDVEVRWKSPSLHCPRDWHLPEGGGDAGQLTPMGQLGARGTRPDGARRQRYVGSFYWA